MSETTTIPQPSPAPAQTACDTRDERGVIRGVTRDLYDRLSDSLGEHSPFRVAYDGTDIEIMTLGPKHEDVRDLLNLFVNEVHFGLNINCKGLGSTTWKRAARRRGIEADLCYYFDAAKIRARDAAAARDSNDVADYPNPDLVVEIDISPPEIDRPGIYSALQVSEVWRYRDNTTSIEQLDASGNYVKAQSSLFLHVRADEIDRWLSEGKSGDRNRWRRRLQKWVKTVLKPRVGSAQLEA